MMWFIVIKFPSFLPSLRESFIIIVKGSLVRPCSYSLLLLLPLLLPTPRAWMAFGMCWDRKC